MMQHRIYKGPLHRCVRCGWMQPVEDAATENCGRCNGVDWRPSVPGTPDPYLAKIVEAAKLERDGAWSDG